MASPTAPIITSAGISAPTFAQILAYLQGQYQSIFGADVYLGNDSQDGQLLSVFAQAISDANSAAIAVYNSFSPATAQGAGLSSNVQINGLTRLIPSASTAALTLTGVAGSIVTNGQARDTNQNLWALPTTTTIGSGGTVTVTATCLTLGSITAAPGAITGIQTPSFGWQSVTNSAAAIVGAPVESDAALRLRQEASTTLPSITIFEGIIAALENIPAVGRVRGYENNTVNPLTVAGGSIPANNLAFIVENGVAIQTAVFQALFEKGTPGIPTYKDAAFPSNGFSQTVTDTNGSTRVINFMTPVEEGITVVVTVHPLSGWDVSTETLIINAVVAYFSTLPIGVNISYFSVIPVITSLGTPPGATPPAQVGTFSITALTLNGNTIDVVLNYNDAVFAGCTVNAV